MQTATLQLSQRTIREADNVMHMGEFADDPCAGIEGSVVASVEGNVWMRPFGEEKLIFCDPSALLVLHSPLGRGRVTWN